MLKLRDKCKTLRLTNLTRANHDLPAGPRPDAEPLSRRSLETTPFASYGFASSSVGLGFQLVGLWFFRGVRTASVS